MPTSASAAIAGSRRHARASGHRRHRQRVVRPRRPHARRRLLGIRRDEHDDARRRAAGRARSRRACRAPHAPCSKHRVELAPVDAGHRHVDDARRSAIRSTCRSKRRSRCSSPPTKPRSRCQGVRFVQLRRCSCCARSRRCVTSEGTNVTQTFIRVGPTFYGDGDRRHGDFQIYEEELAPRGQGWEYVESLDMPGNAERWASIAAEKLTAKSVEAGQYDLILDPTNLWLTIHESIGHPDRARSRDRRGGQLRRHELRRAAGEDDRPAAVRPGVHEHPGRPHAGRLALARGVGRRGRAGRPVADHREGHLQGLPDDARAGGADSAR